MHVAFSEFGVAEGAEVAEAARPRDIIAPQLVDCVAARLVPELANSIHRDVPSRQPPTQRSQRATSPFRKASHCHP